MILQRRLAVLSEAPADVGNDSDDDDDDDDDDD